MKTRWYRGKGAKATLIVLAHMAAILAVLSILAIAVLYRNGIQLADASDFSYEQTGGFAQKVMDDGLEILRGIQAEKILEHEEAEDPVVDIRELASGEELSWKNSSGLAYRLSDLEKWAQNGWEYEYPETYDDTAEYSEEYAAARSERENENEALHYEYKMKERFQPVGAADICEVVQKHPESWKSVEAASDTLNSALENLSVYCRRWELLQKYREGNTNLTYLYVDREHGAVYSNDSTFRYSNYSEKLEEYGEDPQVQIAGTLDRCSTSLKLSLQEWQETCMNHGLQEEDLFVLRMNPAYPIGDDYAESRNIYNQYAPCVIWLPVGIAAGLLIFMVSLILLTAGAGRRQGDEELHLCAFDRWYTEIGAAAVFFPWLFGMGMLIGSYDFTGYHASDAFYLVFAAVYTVSLFLAGYLSLVRRIKAKILWSGSLTGRIWQGIRQLWKKGKEFLKLFAENTASRVRTAAMILGFFVLQFFLMIIICSGGGIFLLLLLAADAAVFFYAVKKAVGREEIMKGMQKITEGELQYKISESTLTGDQKIMAGYVNRIGEGLDAAVENSLKNERMKAELITNVSHDIKTPLTSIINYVDLLKREEFEDPKIRSYLDILEEKSRQLKILTEDVVEASKASTGNITLEMTQLDFVQLLQQVTGEFEEKFRMRSLELVTSFPMRTTIIYADGRRLWRVLENVFENVFRYAMENTRVYADVSMVGNRVEFTLKNISAQSLNISADELTERFIRGDVSRNTEGSGLGLSIARDLTELQGGTFRLYLDGDLFKVMISFEKALKGETS